MVVGWYGRSAIAQGRRKVSKPAGGLRLEALMSITGRLGALLKQTSTISSNSVPGPALEDAYC